jgi:hypothetical protein
MRGSLPRRRGGFCAVRKHRSAGVRQRDRERSVPIQCLRMGGLVLGKKTRQAHSQIWEVLAIRDRRLLIRFGRGCVVGVEERIDLPA